MMIKNFFCHTLLKLFHLILRLIFKFVFTNSIVLINFDSPSRAKNSHCTGINTSSLAVKELTVNNPNVGGVSIKI